MESQKKILSAFIVIIIVLGLGGGLLIWQKKNPAALNKAGGSLPAFSPGQAQAGGFGVYSEPQVQADPQLAPYFTNQDLSNIENKKLFTSTEYNNSRELSPEAKNLLVKNLFVVMPLYSGRSQEFFQLYEQNRYAQIPNFVTADSVLHNYHLVFDYLLKNLEEEKLIPELKTLTSGMLAESKNQYGQLKGTSWETAAARNVGFFSVADRLLGGNSGVPAYVSGQVNGELALIDRHDQIQTSPLINMGQTDNIAEAFKEDYTQYVPRGHYDKSEQLRQYFKAMMWYGRMTFRFKSDEEIKSAALMSLALSSGGNAQAWEKIYAPTAFFVGSSDDITYLQLGQAAGEIYQGKNLSQTAADAAGFARLKDRLAALQPPQINSIPVFEESANPDREKEIKGFRFMGQRFTVDASVFQRLVYREVKENPQGQKRLLPKGLDIPAALGSQEALDILTSQKETSYAGYNDNLNKLKSYLAGLSRPVWTQNLYWGWLNALRPLAELKPAGYPSFMLNQAWTRKNLNTFLASWTELKHDTILYAKQVYAELGGGGETLALDDKGYVEPEVYVYARLAGLLKLTREGLSARGILTDAAADNLSKMEDLAIRLKTISEKELGGKTLTDEEYDLIRSYGGQLEHFWLEANRDEMQRTGVDQGNYLQQNPAALVADVATDPNGYVLEEGTGPLREILAVVPVAGGLRIASGVVWSQYEFSWPMNDRLTDERWRELINGPEGGGKPAQAEWQKSFQVDGSQ